MLQESELPVKLYTKISRVHVWGRIVPWSLMASWHFASLLFRLKAVVVVLVMLSFSLHLSRLFAIFAVSLDSTSSTVDYLLSEKNKARSSAYPY